MREECRFRRSQCGTRPDGLVRLYEIGRILAEVEGANVEAKACRVDRLEISKVKGHSYCRLDPYNGGIASYRDIRKVVWKKELEHHVGSDWKGLERIDPGAGLAEIGDESLGAGLVSTILNLQTR